MQPSCYCSLNSLSGILRTGTANEGVVSIAARISTTKYEPKEKRFTSVLRTLPRFITIRQLMRHAQLVLKYKRWRRLYDRRHRMTVNCVISPHSPRKYFRENYDAMGTDRVDRPAGQALARARAQV